METVTFAFDCELDINHWIQEGAVVQVSENPHHLNKHENFIPVIITEGYTYDEENKVSFTPYVEWFLKSSFVEYN